MKNYKRLTTKCEVGIGLTETSGNIVNDYEKVVNRLAELEDKIESGEIDYVTDNKKIARLTAENKAYADNILRAIKILQNSDGFKAQTAINQAIGVLLGNKDNKYKREID